MWTLKPVSWLLGPTPNHDVVYSALVACFRGSTAHQSRAARRRLAIFPQLAFGHPNRCGVAGSASDTGLVDLANFLASLAAFDPGVGFGRGHFIFIFPSEDPQPTGSVLAEILKPLPFQLMWLRSISQQVANLHPLMILGTGLSIAIRVALLWVHWPPTSLVP